MRAAGHVQLVLTPETGVNHAALIELHLSQSQIVQNVYIEARAANTHLFGTHYVCRNCQHILDSKIV